MNTKEVLEAVLARIEGRIIWTKKYDAEGTKRERFAKMATLMWVAHDLKVVLDESAEDMEKMLLLWNEQCAEFLVWDVLNMEDKP